MTTLTTVVFSLVAMYQPNTPDIFLALGPDSNSKQIRLWYHKSFRDNVAPGIQISALDNIRLSELDKSRNALIPHIILVEWDDLDARKQYSIGKVSRPHIRLGRYGGLKEIPDRAFIHPYFSFAYTQYVFNTWDLHDKIEKWENYHYSAHYHAYSAYYDKNIYGGEEVYYDAMDVYDYETLFNWSKMSTIAKKYPPVPVIAPRPHPEFLYRNPLDF